MEGRRLGAGATAWVRSSLRDGRSVSAAVLAAVDLDAGSAFAIVPEGTSVERAAALATGGLASPWEAGEALDAVVAEVAEVAEVTGGTPATLVVEDAHALASDEWVSRRRHPAVATVGDVVVHWLPLPAEPGQAGRFVLRKGGGYPTNAFVVARPPEALGLAPMAEPAGLPEAVAGGLVAVVVAAYDAESVVVWTPGDLRAPTPGPGSA